jgi:ATP-dependent RNA helicase RhlE
VCRAQEKDSSLTQFQDLQLDAAIMRALAEEQYVTPTPIQAQTIPVAMEGRDVIGIAQTGTGKTAAFALPILHRLAAAPQAPSRKNCRVLVLSPTRELSGQILDSFRAYGRHLRLRSALAIGGVSMGGQVRSLLNGVDILVATPGRLIDLVRANALRLGEVSCLVLDEADRMLDMGFINDIRKIVTLLPKERQTLMFSATMPRTIADLAAQMLRDPVKVAVAPVSSTAERVAQRVIRVDRAAKSDILVEVLRGEAIDRALVFTRTKHGADKVVRVLEKSGIAAAAIHGNKSQSQRERVLKAFRSGEIRTLVATDIAARGIDVDGVSHVVNFDVPNVPETYVHRIGRTARAGAEGIAISLCDGEEAAYLRDIEKLIRIALPVTDRRTASDRGEPGRTAPGHRAAHRSNGGRQGDRTGHGGGHRQPGASKERPRHEAHGSAKSGQPNSGQHKSGPPKSGQHKSVQHSGQQSGQHKSAQARSGGAKSAHRHQERMREQHPRDSNLRDQAGHRHHERHDRPRNQHPRDGHPREQGDGIGAVAFLRRQLPSGTA